MTRHLTPYGGLVEWNRLQDEYQWSNKVPKRTLFVKLSDSANQARRNFIANGIRATFKSEYIMLYDVKEQIQSVRSTMSILDVFTGIIGFISLILAFFLILIATTSNLR